LSRTDTTQFIISYGSSLNDFHAHGHLAHVYDAKKSI